MPKRFRIHSLSFAALTALPLLLTGCGERESKNVPGLSDLMIATQVRHAKLWFAGEARNWPLAEYELHELEEGFEMVVEFHPTHEDSPVSLAETLPALTKQSIAALHSAIANQDSAEFVPAFDFLTKSCNACHLATNYEFNVIRRPTSNWFSNQDFSPID